MPHSGEATRQLRLFGTASRSPNHDRGRKRGIDGVGFLILKSKDKKKFVGQHLCHNSETRRERERNDYKR